MLGLAGTWPSWKLSGIKAVLALSPYSQPYDRQRTLAGVTAFDGATHFAWTNLSTVAHESIVAYSLAFVNHYVKGEPGGALQAPPRSDVAVYRYASEMGTATTAGNTSHARLRGRP